MGLWQRSEFRALDEAVWKLGRNDVNLLAPPVGVEVRITHLAGGSLGHPKDVSPRLPTSSVALQFYRYVASHLQQRT